ncbi:5-carboxymethyl-2-hydroxymuconate isomerase [Phaeobacter gallaeciensis]|uniref:5-carboxymethyl-2-hydroxymuconate isomerase n=1 Tax=Phaeobacter gallaeciensis TaxID=60890 RepID=UPI0023807D86|nr:5-carboxymethyl-2-hydroxymuconate isomerase [Phaeobacter gallaeciensis]MDE4275767.1 5-carboxymethyl-2-hydroxymuconate isomerase [Phaeobacter gallaeciensis]MDE4301020.1 5-carboxymethyl-2-hydroxymuconate isomerase [Phaeobacter gallaeciensis]MDE5186184.1 5-carboxymethyl-2-hydroxymuconate isomerase [Phaeobacter gallaeciensis]
MPHITVDYSPNVAGYADIAGLCNRLRLAAADTGVLPLAGIRVRAFAATHVSIADGDPQHGYVDIAVRLRGGRDLDTRKRATAEIFEAARHYLEPAMQAHPLALSFEMRDIDPDLSPKCGTIRDHMKKAEQ